MRVKFLRDELYENEGRGVGHSFKTGEVYDFDQAFAERWIRRGAAEAVGDDGKPVDVEARFTPVVAAPEPKAEKVEPVKDDEAEKTKAKPAVTHKPAGR